jgi:hypothetical protein
MANQNVPTCNSFTPFIELVSRANIVLNIGNGALQINTSSHALSLGSNMFRTMLGSAFLERAAKTVDP